MTSMRRLGFVLGLALGIGLTVEARSAGPTQEDEGQQTIPVRSEAKDVQIVQSVIRDTFHSEWVEPSASRTFHSKSRFYEWSPDGELKAVYNAQGEVLGLPLVQSFAGYQYVFVLVNAEFPPKGWSWDLSAFRLEDGQRKGYPVVAFDPAEGRRANSDRAYLASKGALAKAGKDKKLTLSGAMFSDTKLPLPNRIIFPYANYVWPGGTCPMWLVFEVPKSASDLVLQRDPDKPIEDDKKEWKNLVEIRSRLIPKDWIRSSTTARLSLRTWTDASGQNQFKAEMIGHTDTTVRLKKEDGETFNMPVAELSEKDQKMLRDQGVIPVETTWEEGPLVPGPTTAEIPVGLRADADRAFRSGKRLFLWDADVSPPIMVSYESGVIQRQIGYAFAPDAKVTFFSLHAHLLRQVDGYKYDEDRMCVGPTRPGRVGTTVVQISADQPDVQVYATHTIVVTFPMTTMVSDFAVGEGKMTINAVPLGMEKHREPTCISNEIESAWRVEMPAK